MNFIKMVLIISSVLILSSCFSEQWEGFVYPDKNNLTVHQGVGVYESLEACRAASLELLSRISSIEKGDYECGLNCKSENGFSVVKICEKTER